jgi:N-acyl-D-amino-acid deacylase
MLDRRLDFDPGARFAYSNLGFLVLGRVIEKLSGQPYAEFVRLQVLAPLGIERMRQGRTQLSLRAPGEVRYYDYPGAPLLDSLMPGVNGKVAEPYSGIVAFESVDSAGSWIASAIDLTRIFTMLDGWGAPALLTRESIQQIVTPVFPTDASSSSEQLFDGLGIFVSSSGADAIWEHGGGVFGTAAFACRPRNGWAWAVIFNSAPLSFLDSSPDADFLGDLQDISSVDSLKSVSWLAGDLFPQYLPSGRPVSARRRGEWGGAARHGDCSRELLTIALISGRRTSVAAAVSDGVPPVAYAGTSRSTESPRHSCLSRPRKST